MIKKILKKIRFIFFYKHKFKKISSDASIGRKITYANSKNVSIGKKSSIGDGCVLLSLLQEINIGNFVMLGPQVLIVTGNHRTDIIGEYMVNIGNDKKLPENDQPVIIEDDVWIGARAIILKGVTIGRGSIIGAGAIVTRDVPPYSIYAGTKVVKSRFTEEEIVEHERILTEKYGGVSR